MKKQFKKYLAILDRMACTVELWRRDMRGGGAFPNPEERAGDISASLGCVLDEGPKLSTMEGVGRSTVRPWVGNVDAVGHDLASEIKLKPPERDLITRTRERINRCNVVGCASPARMVGTFVCAEHVNRVCQYGEDKSIHGSCWNAAADGDRFCVLHQVKNERRSQCFHMGCNEMLVDGGLCEEHREKRFK